MKAFITGGSGFIGGGVAKALSLAGYQVTAMCKSQESASQLRALGYNTIAADMAQPGAWLKELGNADVVVHAAQSRSGKRLSRTWVEQSRAARDATLPLMLSEIQRSARCKAFIYTSGIAAVGDHGDVVITETTPRVSSALGDFHAEGEAMVLEAATHGVPSLVLRPGFVYGATGSFAKYFIREAQKGFFPYPGKGMNYMPWVHTDDLAKAYVLAAAQPPKGQLIHIVDNQPLRLTEFASLLVRTVGKSRAQRMPKWLVSLLAGGPLVEMLTSSYRANNEKAKRILGWEPQHPTMEEGLPEVVERYTSQVGKFIVQ
jgi:nucleoside-diphosphate-sugar epimerase